MRQQLLSIASVQQATVIIAQQTEQQKMLAFLVGPSESDAVMAIRSELSALLPDHMIPNEFYILEKLPLTPNGKLDKQALIRYQDESLLSQEHIAPRNEHEKAVAEIWQNQLAKSNLSVTAGFFDLGGHSLAATRIAAQVQSQFGIAISLKELFELSTIEKMAAYIETTIWVRENENMTAPDEASGNEKDDGDGDEEREDFEF